MQRAAAADSRIRLAQVGLQPDKARPERRDESDLQHRAAASASGCIPTCDTSAGDIADRYAACTGIL
jgi:hypothetical protein